MAHPNVTMRRSGKLWHLEDTVPSADAFALARHLRRTEDKRAITRRVNMGLRQVWWAKK